MLLSTTEMHALRALIFLARQGAGEPVSTGEIAEALTLPANYLGKTLRLLANQGIVRSTRGRSGGFTLARSPSDIALADLTQALQPDERFPNCLLGGPCRPEDPCVAHERWTRWEREASELMNETRISEFLGVGDHTPVIPQDLQPLGAHR